eukprot:g5802.t1
MFILPLLLVTVASSTYTSEYHEITTNLWSQIPDTLPTGNTVPKGCTCELPANPCLNFDCDCLCDLTAGACDANCCCDTECTEEEINIFRDSDSCADETAATGTTTQCLSNDDLYDINPKYSMNVENFIEKSMLCIVVDNSPSDGSFYNDPGTLTAQTFCDSDLDYHHKLLSLQHHITKRVLMCKLLVKSCPQDCGSVSIRGDIETRPE